MKMDVNCDSSVARGRTVLLLLGMFMCRSWGLDSTSRMVEFSWVYAGMESLETLASLQDVLSALDCARACNRRRGEEPECGGCQFDPQVKRCHLYTGPINETVSSDGPPILKFMYYQDAYPPQPLPTNVVFRHLRDSKGRYGSYYLSEDPMTYPMSRDQCASLGGYLMEITAPYEITILTLWMRYYTTKLAHNESWVGVIAPQHGGNFVTQEHGTPLGDHWTWAGGAPTTVPYEDCATLTYNGLELSNTRCDSLNHYLCEKDYTN